MSCLFFLNKMGQYFTNEKKIVKSNLLIQKICYFQSCTFIFRLDNKRDKSVIWYPKVTFSAVNK